ncbi:MAG: AAA family ATPase, partial [Bacteroidales bacterium]|nr:AAA family ATPase [Bacteroidales bacterium]
MRKYPVGIQTFAELIREGYIYVDKTDLVWQLAHYAKYIFMSRPRRFGKSLLTSTLHSYFRGQKELFKGLAIEKMERQWTPYPVLHFSLASAKRGTVEDLNAQLRLQLEWAAQDYQVDMSTGDVTVGLQSLVKNLYLKTGKQVAVLIDEYDAPLLTVLHDADRLEPMRTALQSFYAPLKDLDPYLRFVFITGVTKFSQLSIFSQLNNLKNVSLLPQFSALCGFTEQEVRTVFEPDIEQWRRASSSRPRRCT